jgi:hypothetical protein
MPLKATSRDHLDAQGFCGFDDATPKQLTHFCIPSSIYNMRTGL